MIITLDNLGGGGFIGDLPAHDLPQEPMAWSSIQNVGFRSGIVERVQGYAAGFDTTPTQAAYGLIATAKNDGTPFLVAGGTTKLFSYNGTTENELTGTTTPAATADTKWTMGVFTGFVVANDSVGPPQFITIENLASATNFADLTNWPASTTCKVFRPYKYFLVAAYLTESSTVYPYKVRWSDAAVPGALPSSWVASASNQAGSVDLSADDGPVVEMLDFADQLAIYRESGVTLMRLVGGNDVMVFNRVSSASGGGLIGNNCVVDVPGIGHVAMSKSDIYVFNGSAVESLLNRRMRRWFQANLSQTIGHRSFLVHHSTSAEVWCCFPESGGSACTKAIIWNYADNTLGVRDLPNCTAGVHATVKEAETTTWATISGTWNSLTGSWSSYALGSKERKTVLASTDNKLYVIGNAVDANGSSLIGQVERIGISLGDAQRLKYVRGIWPRFDGAVGQQIEISVGTHMAVDEPVEWQPSKTYTLGTSRKVDVNRTGRFIALRVRSPSGGQWRLKSMDVDVEQRGLW